MEDVPWGYKEVQERLRKLDREATGIHGKEKIQKTQANEKQKQEQKTRQIGNTKSHMKT